MAGGPLLPSSIYVGGASGSLSPQFYISGAASGGGAIVNSPIEGIAVIANLNAAAADAQAAYQFNLPEVLPTGTLKCRILAWANATAGNAIYTLADAGTAPGSNIAGTTLATDASAVTLGWAAAQNDIIREVKVTLTGAGAVANNIFTVSMTWNKTSWTLAVQSVWQLSLVWE
jgi:hypothetical protein